MTSILEQVNKKLITAMKTKDPALNSLKLVKAELINNQKSKKPSEELDVLYSYKKKLEKSLQMYEAGSTQANNLAIDISTVSIFLPKEISDEELKNHIAEVFTFMIANNIMEPIGVIIKNIKDSTGSRNGKLIAYEVKRHMEFIK